MFKIKEPSKCSQNWEKLQQKIYTKFFFIVHNISNFGLTSLSEILKEWRKNSVLRTGIKGWWRKFKMCAKSQT